MWIVFSLAAAFCAAIVIVLSKAGIKQLDPTLVFGLQALCIVVVTWSIIFVKKLHTQFGTMERKTWMIILIAGVLTAVSSIFSFQSLKLGHASRTASFEKISLVISAVLAIIFLKEKFNWQLGIGLLLMIGGALLIGFSDTSKQ